MIGCFRNDSSSFYIKKSLYEGFKRTNRVLGDVVISQSGKSLTEICKYGIQTFNGGSMGVSNGAMPHF